MNLKKLTFLILVALLASCKKEQKLIGVSYDFNLSPTFALDKVNFISKSGNTVRFEVKTIRLYGGYTFGDIAQGSGGYDTVEFQNSTDWTFTLDSVNYSSNSVSTENYSVALIIDKSMSELNGDAYSDGIHYFIEEATEAGNECALIGSSRIDGNTPMKNYSDGFFTEYTSEKKDALFNLFSEDQPGTSSLFDAINQTLDLVNSQASNNQKHIVVMWNEEDDMLGIDAETIAEKADSLNIRVSFIRFDWSDSFLYECEEIAIASGGLFMNPSSTASFYTCTFSLHKLLTGNYRNMNWYVKFNSGWISSSSSWRNYLYVDQSYIVPFTVNY